MTNRLVLILTLLLILNNAFSQKKTSGSVKGNLTDTAYRETMADATVSVFNSNANDSSVVSYTRADEKGSFIIKNLNEGSYRLIISFQGYNPLTRKFTISATNPDVNMGTINMTKASDMLEEVIVERPPITIKGDTVEFAASAFKTKPNAVAEDLLKKLPGVEVDKDGTVTAQGETIQKIYVNGKEFFGNDPKMATKNITADMIESVQVFDDMSEQAKFTRIDDGSRTKTINIKLKKGMDQGYFGRGNIGYGTDDRYSGAAMMNKFQGDRRISLVGSSNNINKQGFNSKDIVGGMGGFGGGGGGGGRRGGGGGIGGGNSGLTKASNVGFNYSDNFGKVTFTGSYMYGTTNSRTSQTSYNQYKLGGKDSTSYETDTSSSFSSNKNHNFNLKLEYDIDSMNSIIYTPSFTIQNSNDNSADTNFIRAVKPGLDYVSLSQISKRQNERNGITLTNEFLFRHRFKKFGRTFTLGYKNDINDSKGSGNTYSPITYYDSITHDVDRVFQQDFLSSQKTRSSNNVISSSYTEPIGTNKILEVNYAYTNRNSTSDKDAYSYNTNTKEYDSLNPQQTNYFKNIFQAHRVGINFRYKNKLYGFQIGGAMQASQLDNNSIRPSLSVVGKDSAFGTKQNYINFFPTANFNYDFNRRKNIQVKYSGRTNQPSVSQLQDVRDERNIQRIITGNPGLKQEFNNKINISYKSFNETTFRYLNVNVNYDQTMNKIVNGVTFDSKYSGALLIKPVNLNGTYNASYDISVGVPLRQGMKGSSINLGNRMSYGRNPSLQLGRINYTNSFNVSQSAGINLDVKEKLNMEFKGRFSYNGVTYTAADKKSTNANTNYFSQNYSTDINYFITNSLILSTDFDYAINTGRASGFNQSIPLWNAGAALQVFKKKNGEIKLTVNDLLNQNKSITRRIEENNIYDSRTIVLQRYFLLTFTYSFNRFGDKGKRREADLRLPGEEEGGMRRGGGRGRGGRGGGGRGNF